MLLASLKSFICLTLNHYYTFSSGRIKLASLAIFLAIEYPPNTSPTFRSYLYYVVSATAPNSKPNCHCAYGVYHQWALKTKAVG